MGSFAVWGPSRSDLDRLAWSIAAAVDESFAWIELSEGSAPPGSRELEVLEEIGLDRIDRLDRAELLVPTGPFDRTGPPHDRTDRTPPVVDLPIRLRDHLDRRTGPGVAKALVLANLDRVLDLVPDPSRLLSAIVAGSKARRLDLIATFGLDAAPPLEPFECLVNVRAGADGNIWNPIVDWTSRSAELSTAVPPPPGPTPSHREVVQHLRGLRTRPA
jgi:hypothetical protein